MNNALNNDWPALLSAFQKEREQIALGGGEKAIHRQHEKHRMTARERTLALVDPGTAFFELGRFAAWGMYADWGGAPSASVVCGIGRIAGRGAWSSPTMPPSKPGRSFR